MPAICSVVGPAPAAAHRGFKAFDYNQVGHPHYAVIGVPPF